MQQFMINPDGIRQINNKSLRRTIPFMLIAITAGIVIPFINSDPQANYVSVLPVVIPLMAFGLGFGLYRGAKRLNKLFESYTLTFNQNLITREQINTPVISLYFSEISEIVKNKNGSFTIKGRHPEDLIGIPAEIENYEEVEILLNGIKPVTAKAPVPLLEKYQALVPLIVVGLMVCVYAVNNKIIVAASGILFTGLMIYSILKIRNSKNIDSNTRKVFRWIYLVMASVICVMILKLTDGGIVRH